MSVTTADNRIIITAVHTKIIELLPLLLFKILTNISPFLINPPLLTSKKFVFAPFILRNVIKILFYSILITVFEFSGKGFGTIEDIIGVNNALSYLIVTTTSSPFFLMA